MRTFGQVIRERRIKNKQTLREVAEYVGITISNLSDIEHGLRRPPRTYKLELLAEILDLEFEHLQNLSYITKGKIDLENFSEEQREAILNFLDNL
jgi:transcriptional regulator with XRE-family HTH domain